MHTVDAIGPPHRGVHPPMEEKQEGLLIFFFKLFKTFSWDTLCCKFTEIVFVFPIREKVESFVEF